MSYSDLNTLGWMGAFDEPIEQLWLGKLSLNHPWTSAIVHWIIRSVSTITQVLKSKSHLVEVIKSSSSISTVFRRRSTLIGDYHVR